MRKDGWPVAGTRTRQWRPREDGLPVSARRLAAATGPYDVAVVPAIAKLPVSLPSRVLADAEEATRAMAAFDAVAARTLTPYTSILLRSESAASSRIEDLTASARAIAEAEIGENAKVNPATILANVAAMEAALEASQRFTERGLQGILEMHRVLMEPSWPAIAGRWREQQVWIGGTGLGPVGADFVPPEPGDVPSAMADLQDFMERDDLSPLVHAAVAHAQFETIHPFVDGNGRTGRALLHAHLRHTGVTTSVAIPISTGLLVQRERYFAALTSYREGDLEPIVTCLTRAASDAVETGSRLLDDLAATRQGWSVLVRARADSTVWRVLDVLVRRPVVTADVLARELGVSTVTARNHLRDLVAAGILRESTGRSRNRVWRAPDVLAVLDAYAEGVGRRA